MYFETESKNGVSFILHSESDKELFKNNNASSFENVFKKPIRLDLENEYEICLANIHTPVHQFSLIENDFEKSQITYNLGIFINKNNKFIPIAKSIKLWSCAPDKSFMGLEETDTTRHDISHRRENFIKELSRSLKLEDEIETSAQVKCLTAFKKELDRHNRYSNSGLLMATYDDTSGILQFDHVPKDIEEIDRFIVFQDLLTAVGSFPPDVPRDHLKTGFDTFVRLAVDKYLEGIKKKKIIIIIISKTRFMIVLKLTGRSYWAMMIMMLMLLLLLLTP